MPKCGKCRPNRHCCVLGRRPCFKNIRARLDKSSDKTAARDRAVRLALYLGLSLAFARYQQHGVATFVSAEQRETGFAPPANKSAISKIQHVHYARRENCSICSVRLDTDPCVAQECQPTIYDQCFPVGNGTQGPHNNSVQVGCMCLHDPNLNALVHVSFSEEFCSLQVCESQSTVCEPGCCHSREGEAKTCAKTMILYDTEIPADADTTTGAVARNGTWHEPLNTCAETEREGWEPRWGACEDNAMTERLREVAPYRDCSSSTWKLCCPSEKDKNCRRGCHAALWEQQQEAMLRYIPLTLFWLFVEGICSRRFCRWSRHYIPDRQKELTRLHSDREVAMREYDIQVALVIGCSGGELTTPVNDAKAIAKALTGYSLIICLTESEATPESVDAALKVLLARCAGHTAPTILISFGGHGSSTPEGTDVLHLHRSEYPLEACFPLIFKMHTYDGMEQLWRGARKVLRESNFNLPWKALGKDLKKVFDAPMPGPAENAHCVFILNACRTQANPFVLRSENAPRSGGLNGPRLSFFWAVSLGKRVAEREGSSTRLSPFTAALVQHIKVPHPMTSLFTNVKRSMPPDCRDQPCEENLPGDVSLAPPRPPQGNPQRQQQYFTSGTWPEVDGSSCV